MADVRSVQPQAQAPAIVLGVETQIGLALVRELGRAGVRVVAVSHDPCALGLASRYVWRRLIVGPPRSAAVIEAINQQAAELGNVSLLTVSEGNLVWLDRERARFDARVHLAVPAAAAMRSVLDKSQTLATAKALGIAVPRTASPSTLAEWEALAADFPYPAVLKWADANAVAPGLAAAGIEMVKAEYVDDASQLNHIGARYAAVGVWPLVQQYCAGYGLGQFFFMHDGQAVRRFQHRRVAEWPPEGGYSSVCDAVPLGQHTELQAQSVALLQALGWQGVAMVEYRYDPVRERAVLMEINGRFWGSLPLAVSAGVGFARLAHAAALREPLPALAAPLGQLRSRMVTTEIKRLRRLWLQPGLIADKRFAVRPVAETLRFLGDYVRPGVRYFVWSADDPMPSWRDLRNAIA
jgi:predicted ATP-grasp superfamily ATP-dependent carboligase